MGKKNRAKKPASSEHITISRRDLKAYENEMFWGAFRVLIPAVSWTLRTEYGFGTERLKRFLTSFRKILDYMDDGTITVTDIRKQLQEECDIDVWLPKDLNNKRIRKGY